MVHKIDYLRTLTCASDVVQQHIASKIVRTREKFSVEIAENLGLPDQLAPCARQQNPRIVQDVAWQALPRTGVLIVRETSHRVNKDLLRWSKLSPGK